MAVMEEMKAIHTPLSQSQLALISVTAIHAQMTPD